MEVKPTPIPDLLILKPKVFKDNRGFFVETYNQKIFAQHGLNYDFIQDNHAFSACKGVLRGLHYQKPPMAQAKLVRVARGKVFDVTIDLRKNSPTFGQHFGLELSAENHLQLLIPRGFAHGYLVLEENTDFLYKVDNFYSPQDEGGIIYNDPDLNINWPLDEKDIILSAKDQQLPKFKEIISPF